MRSVRVDDVLAAAARRRSMPIPSVTNVLRLVDDEGDGCPGLIVDRYGPVLRLDVRGRHWPTHLHELARALCSYERAAHAVGLLRTGDGKSVLKVLAGDAPRAHIVTEGGVRLLVRTIDEEAAGAGVFVDHREGRAAVRARARGSVVLNLFAHAGAFGAFAIAGGALRVDHVDAAKKCAPWAAVNIALGGEDPRKHRFLVDDALTVVARFANKGPSYDVVVCDAPTTALRPDGARFHVDHHLVALARDCVRCLRPRGALVLSTNHRALGVRDVADAARTGASDAGRSITSMDAIALPPDITTAGDAKLRPMRGVIAIVT